MKETSQTKLTQSLRNTKLPTLYRKELRDNGKNYIFCYPEEAATLLKYNLPLFSLETRGLGPPPRDPYSYRFIFYVTGSTSNVDCTWGQNLGSLDSAKIKVLSDVWGDKDAQKVLMSSLTLIDLNNMYDSGEVFSNKVNIICSTVLQLHKGLKP